MSIRIHPSAVVSLAALALAGCQATGAPLEPVRTAHPTRLVSGSIGLRNLDEDWAPADEQLTLGLQYAQSVTASGHGFEVGFQHGTESATRSGLAIDSELNEIYVGYRHTFAPTNGGLVPFVGAGLAWFDGQIEVENVRAESRSDLGAYLQGGLGLWLGHQVHVSVGGRVVSGATLDFDAGSDLEVKGLMPFLQVAIGF